MRLARALLLVALVASCDRTEADAGLDAKLHVAGAQFFREAMPEAASGPAVRTVNVSAQVRPGSSGRRLTGDVEPAATAVAIMLAGDVGYWVLPTGLPDVAAPGFPTYAAELSFAASLRPGAPELVVRAVDERGRFGPSAGRTLEVRDPSRPEGRLVIGLRWDNRADLDLHVTDPNGVEIWKRNPNSFEPPPPGAPPLPPGASADGGVLDHDSNAGCQADGRRAENVVWSAAPPPGRYVVRIDTFSLCGEPAARWRVEAWLDGASLGASEGTSTEGDTRFSDDRGAGVLALEITVP